MTIDDIPPNLIIQKELQKLLRLRPLSFGSLIQHRADFLQICARAFIAVFIATPFDFNAARGVVASLVAISGENVELIAFR